MKTKSTNAINGRATAGGTFATVCSKVLAQIRDTKAAILAESRDTLKVQEQLLRLALNEAEALAWQTVYPQLLFPALAAEKIRGLAAWHSHQIRVGGRARSSAN